MKTQKYDIEKHPEAKKYLEEHLTKPYGQDNLNYSLIFEIMIELTRKNITHTYRAIINRHNTRDAIRALDVLDHSKLFDIKGPYCELNKKGKDIAKKLEGIVSHS